MKTKTEILSKCCDENIEDIKNGNKSIWIHEALRAMEEYANQFRISSITDEEINEELKRIGIPINDDDASYFRQGVRFCEEKVNDFKQ